MIDEAVALICSLLGRQKKKQNLLLPRKEHFMSESKISHSEKLQMVHLILEGKASLRYATDKLGISLDSIQQWIIIYKSEACYCK